MSESVKLSVTDGPVANLNLMVQGAPNSNAKPVVTATLNDGPLAAPPAVALAASR